MIVKFYRPRDDEKHRIEVRGERGPRGMVWTHQEYRWPGRATFYGSAPDRQPFDLDPYDSEEELLRDIQPHLGEIVPIELTSVLDDWPGWPIKYVRPDGAPEILPGQNWRAGSQITRVLHVQASRDGSGMLSITTQNIVSAKQSVGKQIRDRKPAEWTYAEDRFRQKFRLVP